MFAGFLLAADRKMINIKPTLAHPGKPLDAVGSVEPSDLYQAPDW
jgi:hypothetical protein